MKKILVGLFLLASIVLLTACLLRGRGEVVYEGPVVEYGYQPVLYDGYVVYYADEGIPFIWMDGAQFWIPVAEQPYYVSYYRENSGSYHEWYSNRGDSYRGQRYADRSRDARQTIKPEDHQRVSQPVQRPADNRVRESQPVQRPADNRVRESQPVQRPAAVRPAAEVRPQPQQQPKAKIEPKEEPKPRKNTDN